jgi:hypothetical protein
MDAHGTVRAEELARLAQGAAIVAAVSSSSATRGEPVAQALDRALPHAKRTCSEARHVGPDGMSVAPIGVEERRSKLELTWMSMDGLMEGTTPSLRCSPVTMVRWRMSLLVGGDHQLLDGQAHAAGDQPA